MWSKWRLFKVNTQQFCEYMSAVFVCADVCVFGKWILPLHIVLAVQTGEEKQSESDIPPNNLILL